MKNIVYTVAALLLLSLAACGDSGGTGSGKKALTPRKIDKNNAVEKAIPAGLESMEGSNPESTKKK